MKFIAILLLPIFISLAGQKLEVITLHGADGSRLDNSTWSSTELTGKVHVLFYVDPDEKDLNEHVGQALKAEKFDRNVYHSWAVINMDATWLPNSILESSLEKKQKIYPDTTYVKDFKKILVRKWGLKDDSSNVLMFNKNAEMLYKIEGKATSEQVSELISIIKKSL